MTISYRSGTRTALESWLRKDPSFAQLGQGPNEVSDHVLDTSAVMCVFEGEDGSNQVQSLLEAARQLNGGPLLVSFMTAMELEYRLRRLYRSSDADQALQLFESWPIALVESDAGVRHQAAALKAQHRLSVADAWIAALAINREAELIHKDPEFDQISELKQVRLPYKPSQS